MTEAMYDMNVLFREMGETVNEFEKVLMTNLDLTGYYIDEVAYQFSTYYAFDSFTREAVRQDGCIMFNSAEDHVHTMPLKTCYKVDYRFFTVPFDFLAPLSSVRIEAMLPRDGYSPLHAAEHDRMVVEEQNSRPIHASFKCVNEEQYAAVTHRLRTRDWESVQRCESDYGRFSYWTPINRDSGKWDALPKMYLKPRVNLRDGAGQ